MQADHSLMGRLSDAEGFVFRLQKLADLPCTDLNGEIKNGARQGTRGSRDDWVKWSDSVPYFFSVDEA